MDRSAGSAFVALVFLCAPCPGQRIAVYQSEHNAHEYRGVHQGPLTSWLEEREAGFEVIGDAAASDAGGLAKYDAIITTSTYLVPSQACAGLAGYVEAGGRLMWIDGPARVDHAGLRSVLGLAVGGTYVQWEDASLAISDPMHPVCAGLGDTKLSRAIGNPATAAAGSAHVPVHLKSATDEAACPAVIITRAGRGRTVVYNWIPWLSSEPEARRLIAQGLYFLLDEKQLAVQGAVARPFTSVTRCRQPEPIRVTVRALAASGRAGSDIQARVFAGRWTSRTLSIPLARHDPSGLAVGSAAVEMPTRDLPDGIVEVRVESELDARPLATTSTRVNLTGQLMARLQREQKQRHQRLAQALRGTLGDYDAEPRLGNGRVDIPRLTEQIKTANMNMYDWLIWHGEHDWEDLHRFLPLAEEAGIKVWVTLCPPSEQGGQFPWSEPYRLDFVKWAEEIGKLARRHRNLVALVIDDFWGGNRTLFTPEYVGTFVSKLREYSPDVAFFPTIYWSSIGDDEFLAGLGVSIDGIVFPYTEYVTGESLAGQLEACRRWLGPDKLLMVNVYAAGSGGGPAPDRTAAYMRRTLTVSREKADGIRVYCLPKENMLDDPRYAVTAELYGKWRQRQGE